MKKRHFEEYCNEPENIENYVAAKAVDFKGWHCHHRLETHNSDGEKRLVGLSIEELKALDMYYNRPANELIFLTAKEHRILHNKGMPGANKGRKFSEELKQKMSEAHKGRHHSEETKQKISEANKGNHPSEESRKKMSEVRQGENNPMYGKHFSEETKKKLSDMKKGKHWKLVDGKRVWY